MKEEEIRPAEYFNKFLELSIQDCDKYFLNAETLEISCPACGSTGTQAFIKSEFGYEECPKCLTLYVNPRPKAQYFENYYQYSESQKYWANEFYAATANARKEVMWKPKVERIKALLSEFSTFPIDQSPVINIGAGYGIFEDVAKENGYFPTVSIEPNPHLRPVLEEKGHKVITAFFENLVPSEITNISGPQYHFVSFELFEHLVEPGIFLDKLNAYLPAGGLFIATTLSGTGIDIRELWEKSKSVSPPFHLNFFNPGSVKQLANNHGFDLIDVFTPGELDVDIMCNNIEDVGRFWQSVLRAADDSFKADIQDFLVKNKLSSHMWFILRKKNA